MGSLLKSKYVRQNSKPKKRRWPKREKALEKILAPKLFLLSMLLRFLWLPITLSHLVSLNLLTTSYFSGFLISWKKLRSCHCQSYRLTLLCGHDAWRDHSGICIGLFWWTSCTCQRSFHGYFGHFF